MIQAKQILLKILGEPDMYIGGREDPYLLRWYLIPRNRFFNIYLHKFMRDDDDRALHDHPWPSLSIILKGGYIEWIFTKPELGAHSKQIGITRRRGQFIFRPAHHAHRIELLREMQGNWRKSCPAWTLFITGPRIREWGFHCPQGWRHWKEFTSPEDSAQIGRGCE